MCERCTIIESAFGLRDPLPPRVASLDAGNTIPSAEEDNDGHLLPIKDERNSLSPASPPSINDSNSESDSSSSNNNNNNNSDENSMNSNNTSNVHSNVNSNNNTYSIQPTHATGDFLAVSTSGTPICPKRSDVADLASEAVEPSSTTAKLEDPNTSVLSLIMEHVDILDMLMLNCPDFPTLLALVASCKTAKRAFEEHPQGIIKAILETMPQELQYLTVALIGINGCNIETSYSIKKNMEIWLGKGPKPSRERLQV